MMNNKKRMAAEELLDLYSKGVRDFRDVDLFGLDLNEADLTGADFRWANISQGNLFAADLTGTDLRGANFSNANLYRANLYQANLLGANFQKAYLHGANIKEGDLRKADFLMADIRQANLVDANIESANLIGADLSRADLSRANLKAADIMQVNLTRANLTGAKLNSANLTSATFGAAVLKDTDFTKAVMDSTVFGDTSLYSAKGLGSVRHRGPSTIGTDTLLKSKGRIPDIFLKGCGLFDWEIKAAKLYDPKLARSEADALIHDIKNFRFGSPIQVNPIFISYSHKDKTFVDEISELMNNKGIRYWRDINDMTSGKMEKQIDVAIRHNPTVLLVLSRHSVNSDWVEWEATKARELEKELKRDVLCPVALDDSWETCKWPDHLRNQIKKYHILDFSKWQDPDVLKKQFDRLIKGMELLY